MFEDLWIIDKSFWKYLDYFLEDKKVVWNGTFQFLTAATLHVPLYTSLRWLTTVFSTNSVRDLRAKQATQDLSRIQNSRERDKENPEIEQYEKLPKKIPFYSVVSQEVIENFLDICE